LYDLFYVTYTMSIFLVIFVVVRSHLDYIEMKVKTI